MLNRLCNYILFLAMCANVTACGDDASGSAGDGDGDTSASGDSDGDSGDGAGDLGDGAGDSGDGAGDSGDGASATIGTDGGRVETPTGAAAAEVPPGAVAEDVEIGVAVVDVSSIELPEGATLSSNTFAFTPHGTTFFEPVTLTLTFESDANVVIRLDDDEDTTWEIVDGAQFAGGVATIEVTGFSIYATAQEARECIRLACLALPAERVCGTGTDTCGNTIDLVADCGRAGCSGGDECVSNACEVTDCVSNFDCSTTTAECGIETDNCGIEHDVVADCENVDGCYVLQTCTDSNICGDCTPYANCTDALTDSDEACNGEAPDGCGATMDCSDCPEGETCTDSNICEGCTPYADCAAALTASGEVCNGEAPDGCGETMDCSDCPDGTGELAGYTISCVSVLDDYYGVRNNVCTAPCSGEGDCPDDRAWCEGEEAWVSFWSCQTGGCLGAGGYMDCAGGCSGEGECD